MTTVITVTAPDVDRTTRAGNAEYCRWYRRKVEGPRKAGYIVQIKNIHPKQRGRPRLTEAEKKEARRIYQRKYYRANIETARAYQRKYNRQHKKKQRAKVDCKGGLPRPQTRTHLTRSALMHASTERFLKDFAAILRGEKFVVGR